MKDRPIAACLALTAWLLGLCAPLHGQEFVIQAPVIEQLDSTIRASGGVFFSRSTVRITASEASYNTALRTGLLKDVAFTTCQQESPHYRLKARELALLSGDRVRVRGASVYLGRFRLLTLPSFVFRPGSRGAGKNVFPRPSYDKDEGFGLAQEFRLADADRFQAAADLRVTSRNGLAGEVWYEYGLDGTLTAPPGRFLSCESLRAGKLNVPPIDIPRASARFGQNASETAADILADPVTRLVSNEANTPDALARWGSLPGKRSGASRLRQFGSLSIDERTYDIRNTGLVLSRIPELGITYVAPSVNLARTQIDPGLQIHPQAAVIWGRYEETPGQAGFTSRTSVGLTMAANVLSLGSHFALQPVVSYGISNYGRGRYYRRWSCGAEAARLFENGAIAALSYTRRDESGDSPFLFDTVDIFKELRGALQVPVGRHVLGFAMGYDGDAREIYDWEALYGYRTDCLAGWVTWHSRLQRLIFSVTLTNL